MQPFFSVLSLLGSYEECTCRTAVAVAQVDFLAVEVLCNAVVYNAVLHACGAGHRDLVGRGDLGRDADVLVIDGVGTSHVGKAIDHGTAVACGKTVTDVGKGQHWCISN